MGRGNWEEKGITRRDGGRLWSWYGCCGGVTTIVLCGCVWLLLAGHSPMCCRHPRSLVWLIGGESPALTMVGADVTTATLPVVSFLKASLWCYVPRRRDFLFGKVDL